MRPAQAGTIFEAHCAALVEYRRARRRACRLCLASSFAGRERALKREARDLVFAEKHHAGSLLS
jgi:hypothetical protein